MGPSHIKNMLMFSFNHRVLLWYLNTTKLMKSTMGSIKVRHNKFNSIIRSDGFNFGMKLSFNHSQKLLNVISGLRFVLHEMNPSEARMIINYSEEITSTRNRLNGERTPNITVN